jgi:deoxyribonuclease-4
MFLRPSRQWHAAPLTPDDLAAFRAAADDPRRRGRGPALIRPVVAHADYLINLASPPGVRLSGGAASSAGDGTTPPSWQVPSDVRAKSLAALRDELDRAARLGIPYVVVHAGNHMGAGEAEGLQRVVEALDEVLVVAPGSEPGPPATLLLETTAGQGTAVGWRLEQLAWILERVARPERLGVCADTCHMFAAGYEFRTAEGYDETLRELDRTVGLARVAVWHLNDAVRERGSRVDRHTHLGRGQIGREGFCRLVTDPRWADSPMILETPKEDAAGRAMDPVNLRLLRRWATG